MEFKYCVHYHDGRLSSPYKAVEIKTARIDLWIEKFVRNNSPYVTIMEYELIG